MILLKPITDNQTLYLLPKVSEGSFLLTLREEASNTIVFSQDISLIEAGYYFTYTTSFSLKNNASYELELKQGDKIVFKDKVYCTNHSESFTTHQNDDEYIII